MGAAFLLAGDSAEIGMSAGRQPGARSEGDMGKLIKWRVVPFFSEILI